MADEWTEKDVKGILLDPRTTGVGSFPRVIEDKLWIGANAAQLERMGAQRYLTDLLGVLRDAFEGFGAIGSAFTDADHEKVVMDPRFVGVGSLEPVIKEDVWIAANVRQVERMGAQRFVSTMLDVLRHDFGSEQAKEPREPREPRVRQRQPRKGHHADDALGLYSHILPTLVRMKKRGSKAADDKIDDLSTTIVFDCRGLPLEFVADTGDATFDEMQANHEPVRLPFDDCYFEFAHEIAILAMSNNEYIAEAHPGLFSTGPTTEGQQASGNIVTFEIFKDWSSPSYAPDVDGQPDMGEFYSDFTLESYKEFFAHMKGEGPVTEVPFFVANGSPPEMDAGARLLLGVLTLLQDKLVISSQLKADPRPWLTDHRRLRGQPPKAGDVRILTLNVPAIRNEVKRNPVGTHESPALHWRRGHWRTLHRATDAEIKTWIRKCLVGDPEKGYIAKNYRLSATIH